MVVSWPQSVLRPKVERAGALGCVKQLLKTVIGVMYQAGSGLEARKILVADLAVCPSFLSKC